MTEAQIKRINDELNYIRKTLDRYDDKMDEAEAEGNMERYKKLDHEEDRYRYYFRGMLYSLSTLGYGVYQYDDRWEVYKK